MRFAVLRPGSPEASPRSHGVPRRDVPSRIHVSVAGVAAGHAAEQGLALARCPLRCARTPSSAGSCTQDCIFSTQPGALSSRRLTSRPQPRPQDAPVQPGLRPGHSGPVPPAVPLAVRVMFVISEILDTDHVEASRRCRCWSSRPSPYVCRSGGPSAGRWQPRTRPRRFEPRRARASLRSSRRSRLLLPHGKAEGVQELTRRQGRRHRHAPVDTHRPGRCLAWASGSGTTANATCQRPARSIGHPEDFASCGTCAGPAEPHPPAFAMSLR